MDKVLCVEDDPNLLRLYQDELSEEGDKVILDTSLKAANQRA